MRGRGFCIGRGVPRSSRVLISLFAALLLPEPGVRRVTLTPPDDISPEGQS